MTELEAKLSSLRDAAQQMRRSQNILDEALQALEAEVALLLQAGFQPGSLGEYSAAYAASSLTAHDWLLRLQRFAANLDQAADDITQAVSTAGHITPPVLPYISESVPLALWGRTFQHQTNPRPAPTLLPSQPEALPNSPPLPLGSYVAAINQPLYTQLLFDQRELNSQQLTLSILTDMRQNRADDLLALRNRLLSYDPNSDPAQSARVQALETEITNLDTQINSTRAQISRLEDSIHNLNARLERVTPAPGADLTLLPKLEYGETNLWVQANTQDCVHYIVSRVPVPDALARDAYLWNEQVGRFPQYGIQTGSTPLAGSILVMEREHPYADPVYGHLMLVQRVDADGAVWVTDNTHPTTPVRLSDLTPQTTGPALTYLYLPWFTQG